MKIFAIILGILVILSWLFVMKEYRNGNQNTTKAHNIMLLACLLTLIMTIMQVFYQFYDAFMPRKFIDVEKNP